MAGLQPEQVLSISKKYSAQLATNYATGFDHATAVNNADGSITLTIFFKNGTSVQGKISGVQGVGIVDVEFRSVDGKTHLFCIMSDATEIDAGEVSPPAVEVGFAFTTPTPGTQWAIQHNLDTEYWKLRIHLKDTDGNIVYGNIDTVNTTKNLLIVQFKEPIAGEAYIKK